VRLAKTGRWLLAIALFTSPALAEDKASLCSACHGGDGNSTTSGVPSIAAQPPNFLETQLILFREGVRDSPQMAGVVKGLSDADIAALARHFASLAAKPTTVGGDDPALLRQGRQAVQKGRCGVCHLADFRGQAQIPRLAGQREEYLAGELHAYRDNRRVGSDTSMNEAMYGVSDADIKALAHFLSRAALPQGPSR
jgi:cytochrome c553